MGIIMAENSKKKKDSGGVKSPKASNTGKTSHKAKTSEAGTGSNKNSKGEVGKKVSAREKARKKRNKII